MCISYKRFFVSFVFSISFLGPAYADISDWATSLWGNVEHAWQKGSYELVIPVNTWHNRLTYSRDEYSQYNEKPWGAGLDKYFVDDSGNTHLIYAIGFSDSNFNFEPAIGYIWQKNWYLNDSKDFAVSLGYNIMITGRYEYYYVPLPSVLPVFGAQYKRVSFRVNYVPYLGSYGGDVFFTTFNIKF